MGGDSVQTIAPGIPNITGKWRSKACDGGYYAEGCVYGIGEPSGGSKDYNAPGFEHLGIDASRSSSIYGASDTVQPPAFTFIAQIKF